MLRKQDRLRKEYVYKKSLEATQRQIWERKQLLKASLASGRSIPTELKKDAETLKKDLIYDEAQLKPTSHMDDEYAYAGVKDPKILITTSRDPSSRLQQFAKEMRLVFPNSQRINRGGYVMKDMVEACNSNEITDLVIIHEHRGQPDSMVVSHFPHGPTTYFSLHNVVLRHDIPNQGTVSEAFPHLIFHNFNTKVGQRVRDVLKYLFPVPKEDSKRVMSFVNENDFISFRHHVYQTVGGGKEVHMAEVGPRFEMRPFQIKLGTVDVAEADNEWVLRPYMRTAKKREML
jgi:U3 small nucleolar ribonucleoprotein protein IMP4